MLPPIPDSWLPLLRAERAQDYFRALETFLESEMQTGQTVLPAGADIFNALKFTSYENVKVLLLGQVVLAPRPGDEAMRRRGMRGHAGLENGESDQHGGSLSRQISVQPNYFQLGRVTGDRYAGDVLKRVRF